MGEKLNKKICVFTIHRSRDVRVFNRHCRSLVNLGMDVTLIAVSETGSYEQEGVKVIGYERWKGLKQRIKTLYRITRLAYQQKADVYHFHDPDLLIFAPWLRIISGRPVVYDIHEFYTRQIPLKFPDFKPLRWLVAGMVWLAETFTGVVCGSVSAVYMEHVKRFSRLGCPAVWTPNFASLEDFNPEPVTEELLKERKNTVIHTGTLSPVRGSLVLLDVARELKQRRPEMKVLVTKRFWSQYHEDAMNEKLVKPEYKEVIEFVPHMTGQELPGFVRKGGVGLSLLQHHGEYVLPSHVPTKFFEYMSQGVPIVASDMPSSYQFVKDENVGLVVPADDIKAYVDAILKIVDDEELTRSMAEYGQRAFIEKYNWGICEQNLREFYTKLLK